MKQKALLSFFAFSIVLFCMIPSIAFAQKERSLTPTYIKARVLQIQKEGVKDIGGQKNIFHDLKLQIIDGSEKGKIITLEHGGTFTISASQKVSMGQTVVLSELKDGKTIHYTVTEPYRIPSLFLITIFFFVFVIIMTGIKGLGAIVGMLISLFIILFFIVPQILAGHDPLFITISGAIVIMLTTIYLAHGFSQRTTIAVIATGLSLVITGLFAVFFVKLAALTGLGTEDAYSLQMGLTTINVKGLLLGSIIIGSLGVLDDTTTTQVTTVYTLSQENEKLSVNELFHRGFVIGKEHITSLVNTLVLAYAGAAIGVFIFLSMSARTQPWWVMINSEMIAEEIVRTLAGSMGLILAVPLTTLLAAFFSKYNVKIK